ncbi:DNA-3-methyladenine glycosylase [Agrobacterium sp. Azo12]|uniref:DNA-3-methyladenine glycosylase n=1 Tax=Agrobacterium sp. Azo12 TaxID=3031129 RepID=UPI0023D813F4|nr:DNA-3-methyladenine glycosylase [Agrobacterium sp. Azo12]MDO5898442.1 DNA-3-methyladenine glycosylase [Agrobacterium sp. Azo12]
MSHQQFFARHAADVARDLVGATFTVDNVGGVIVETEAYTADDEASHSFRGKTPGNSVMFGKPGDIYVYRSYGLHWCLNFVCLPASAVLIRAIAPEHGLAQMYARRKMHNDTILCAGPGRLCQALDITGKFNGLSLELPIFSLTIPVSHSPLQCGPRIGISKAKDVPWRFGLSGSNYLSKSFPPFTV